MKTALTITLTTLAFGLVHYRPSVLSGHVDIEKDCEFDGVLYKVGEKYDVDDPCTACTCEPYGITKCVSQMCNPPPCADYVTDGHCCGHCPNGPNCAGPNGEVIRVGEQFPPTDRFVSCTCMTNEGQPVESCLSKVFSHAETETVEK